MRALARGPAHGVGLPGQQGFVYLRRLGEEYGGGADLAARLQLDHVLLDQVLGGDLRGRAVADDPRRRQGQERELLHQALGVDLLDDADQGVQGHDHQEQHVRPGPAPRRCAG